MPYITDGESMTYYERQPQEWSSITVRYSTRKKLEILRKEAGKECKSWDALFNELLDNVVGELYDKAA